MAFWAMRCKSPRKQNHLGIQAIFKTRKVRAGCLSEFQKENSILWKHDFAENAYFSSENGSTNVFMRMNFLGSNEQWTNKIHNKIKVLWLFVLMFNFKRSQKTINRWFEFSLSCLPKFCYKTSLDSLCVSIREIKMQKANVNLLWFQSHGFLRLKVFVWKMSLFVVKDECVAWNKNLKNVAQLGK